MTKCHRLAADIATNKPNRNESNERKTVRKTELRATYAATAGISLCHKSGGNFCFTALFDNEVISAGVSEHPYINNGCPSALGLCADVGR